MWIDFWRNITKMGKQCIYCGREIPQENFVCDGCAKEEELLENKEGFAGGVLFAYRYDGVVRRLIHRFKYNDSPKCGEFIAQRMVEFLEGYEINADIVTFVPVHKSRLKMRGYDQSELIARHLGTLLDLPCEQLIIREKETAPQYQLGVQERWSNVRNAFVLDEKKQIDGESILLIDDIFTTGATIGSCLKLLTEAGGNVMALTYAKEIPKKEG